jgi:hypothetical protein
MLHALIRWTGLKTIRITARMGLHEMVVLVNSGSTHNFISNSFANLLKFLVIPTEAFSVRVANGEKLKCHGHYDKVQIELQGTEFYLIFFICL